MVSRTEHSPPSRRTWLVPLALAVTGAWSWACQDVLSNGDTLDLDRRAVLDSIAHQVVVPQTRTFAELAMQLQAATATYAAAANPAEAADELGAAQQAWQDAMLQWQRLELMQLGPAAPPKYPGGEGIRDEVYSWTTVDACSIDRAIADGSYAEADFFVSSLVYAYGLDALEYLLMVHDEGHSCGSELDAAWNALSFEEIERRRAQYAAAAATEVSAQAKQLATRWSPEGDDFAGSLAAPGEGESPFDSDVQALDETFRAMFYIDLFSKDAKLEVALGLEEGACDAPPCVDELELPHSGLGADAIAQNLTALRLMVQGGPDPQTAHGFDDLLVEVGQGDVATTLLADIDAAIEQCEGFEAPLQEVIATDTARVEALHAAIKRVTDTLKGPVVMALMLTIPAEGAGDAD